MGTAVRIEKFIHSSRNRYELTKFKFASSRRGVRIYVDLEPQTENSS